MFDSAYVDVSKTFPTVLYMSAQRKDEFISKEDREAGKVGGQKLNKDGVPVWKFECIATNSRGRTSTLTLSAPFPTDPRETFEAMTPVVLDGLQFGVTRTKVAYWTAEGISPAKVAATATA